MPRICQAMPRHWEYAMTMSDKNSGTYTLIGWNKWWTKTFNIGSDGVRKGNYIS